MFLIAKSFLYPGMRVLGFQDKFGPAYQLFLLSNPEDDRPMAAVIPSPQLLPQPTRVNHYTLNPKP